MTHIQRTEKRKTIYALWLKHKSYTIVAKMQGVTPTAVRNMCILHEKSRFGMSTMLSNVLNNSNIDDTNKDEMIAFYKDLMNKKRSRPRHMGKKSLEELRCFLQIEEISKTTHCMCCGQRLAI